MPSIGGTLIPVSGSRCIGTGCIGNTDVFSVCFSIVCGANVAADRFGGIVEQDRICCSMAGTLCVSWYKYGNRYLVHFVGVVDDGNQFTADEYRLLMVRMPWSFMANSRK